MKSYLIGIVTTLCLIVSTSVYSSTITDKEVDKFLSSIPITNSLLNQIKAKVKTNKKLEKSLSKSQLDGRYMRDMVSAVKSWPEYDELEKLVEQSGFENVDEWSLVVDRVFGVVSSAQWVVLAASMPIPNSDQAPVLKRGDNIFEFLDDKSNDEELRKKYALQLQQMCSRMCYDKSDLDVVGSRYNDIEAAIKATKK